MDSDDFKVNILAVGVGGAGSNCINNITKEGLNIKTLAVNTDARHLKTINSDYKLIIGKHLTHGLGAGGDPFLAKRAAEADEKRISKFLEGSDMVFLSLGLGGGTGTGAAPVIAKIAKQQGALLIAVATLPFKMEGKSRFNKARAGLKELLEYADSVITIDNNKLLDYASNLSLSMAFKLADEVMIKAIKGISDNLTMPSLINIDFADIKAVFDKAGLSAILIGEGVGPNKINQAIENTLNHPLLDIDIEGAKGGIVHIEGGEDLTMGDGIKIGNEISKQLSEDAELKLGVRINEKIDGIRITTILTGVKSKSLIV